jgi:hypothetical protein
MLHRRGSWRQSAGQACCGSTFTWSRPATAQQYRLARDLVGMFSDHENLANRHGNDARNGLYRLSHQAIKGLSICRQKIRKDVVTPQRNSGERTFLELCDLRGDLTYFALFSLYSHIGTGEFSRDLLMNECNEVEGSVLRGFSPWLPRGAACARFPGCSCGRRCPATLEWHRQWCP